MIFDDENEDECRARRFFKNKMRIACLCSMRQAYGYDLYISFSLILYDARKNSIFNCEKSYDIFAQKSQACGGGGHVVVVVENNNRRTQHSRDFNYILRSLYYLF